MSMERFFLANAAETYGVAIPDYLAEARAFLAAATKYRTATEALARPTLDGVNAKNIAKTIDAILDADQHDERLALAARVEHIADGDVEAAYQRFKLVLLTELAAPFDKAAAEFMAVYDQGPTLRQDPALVTTLGELVRLRDQMAGRVGNSTPAGDAFDLPTRVAVMPSKDVAINKIPGRIQGTQRGALDWLNAMLSVDGVRLRWHRPDQQAAHVAALPMTV
jgi:hypothetical protein